MKLYDLVIFDVDGTLLDTSEGLISAVKYTIDKSGLPELDENVIKTFIGPPIVESFMRIYDIDDEAAKKMTDIFRNRYKDYDLLKARVYEGIVELFDKLTLLGIKSAIATYKRQDYAENLVNYFGFNNYTDIIFGADNDNKLKKKDIIEKCISVSGINEVKKILMVGDSESDAIGANFLGIDFLGVSFGFGFKSKEEIYKCGAVYAADNASEILKFLERGKNNED